MNEIEELEKKWNCKIDFPSTEMASDVVTISGPEYQVPQAVDEFLVLFNLDFFALANAETSLGNGPREPRNPGTCSTSAKGLFQNDGVP